MILTENRSGAVTTLPGERTSFSIQMGAKAFRTLVDGLYSNKIESPLREVASNAYDSHVAAGCPERPFLLTLPTSLDPIVKVRDFGTGLTDAEVRELYTTLFRSTKDDSNDQVGAFGLGSKSPLAYGDTFTVRAFSGTEERIYTVTTAQSGIPELISVAVVPSTEERGIEVSYPVRHHDVAEFTRAAQKLIYGFPIAPIVDGPALARVEPLLKGDGWELYDQNAKALAGNSNLWVRIGCAIYPAETAYGSVKVGYGNIVVMEAPIGTMQITPSRESLSYDDSTKHNQRALAAEVSQSLYEAVQAEIDKATTRLEKARAAAVWGPIVNRHVGSTTVKLMPEILTHDGYAIRNWRDTEFPAGYLRKISTSRTQSTDLVTGIEYNSIQSMRVIVDNGAKVLRRQLRISALAKGNRYHRSVMYLLKDDETGRARRRLQRVLGLNDNQFTYLVDLPDVPVVRAPRAPAGTAAAKPKWVAGTPWIARERTTLRPVVTFSRSSFQGVGLASDKVIVWMARMIGFDMRTIRDLTPSEVKRLNPDPADEFTTMLLRKFMESAYYKTTVPDLGTQVGLEQSHVHMRLGVEETYKLLSLGKAPWDREAHYFLRVLLAKIPLTDPVKRVYDENVVRGQKALADYPMLREPTPAEIQEYVKTVNSTRKGHKP